MKEKIEPLETVANAYLDQIAERFKLTSDYAVAKLLKLSPQAISKIRRGGGMSTLTAIRVAELLGASHPFGVLESLILDKGHPLDTPDRWATREALEKFMRGMKVVILGVATGLFAILQNQDVRATPASAIDPIYTYATKRLRRLTRWALQALARLAPTLGLTLALAGCAAVGSKEVSVSCGAATTAYLVLLHSPWAVVPAIYTWGEASGSAATDSGSALITCGGAAMAFW